jgi:uncharacterized OB-fold protein
MATQQQRKLGFVGSPDSNPETKPFFDGAAQGKFMLPRCNACGRTHWYPRAVCPHCFSQDLRWIEASGKGTIYSFSVMKRTEIPYAIAYVTLEEGTTMLTNVVETDLDTIRIGQSVRVTFLATEGGPPMPVFRPA